MSPVNTIVGALASDAAGDGRNRSLSTPMEITSTRIGLESWRANCASFSVVTKTQADALTILARIPAA